MEYNYPKNDKIENLIDNFILQIINFEKKKNSLEEKLTNIDLLTDNLIDYCIKKKIFYYVENKIGYNNIVNNFKSHLVNWIKIQVDPNDKIIKKYIDSSNLKSSWDNISDINSLMLKNYKNLNETFEKNVSFDNSVQISNYHDDNEGFEFNYKSGSNLSNSNINNNLINFADENNEKNNYQAEQDSINNLSLYIKILINQNKYLIEFTEKLIIMCKILSDNEIKYKKSNPFDL